MNAFVPGDIPLRIVVRWLFCSRLAGWRDLVADLGQKHLEFATRHHQLQMQATPSCLRLGTSALICKTIWGRNYSTGR